jgi:hypothetical protein
VSGPERLGDLLGDAQTRRGIDPPCREPAAVTATDPLEHQKIAAQGLQVVVDGADARVIELRQHPRLAQEARLGRGVEAVAADRCSD